MHQITRQQRKQQILSLVAQTRMEALDSAVRAKTGAGGCLESLHVSRSTLRLALAAAAGYVGVRMVGRMLSRGSKRPAPVVKVAAQPEPQAPQVGVPGGLLKYLIAQLFTLVLLPCLKGALSGERFSRGADYWRPSRIFFRWIGLER